MQTLNGRLPLEQSSHSRQTLRKRVSDDSRRFIFRRRKKFFDEIFGLKSRFFAYFSFIFAFKPRSSLAEAWLKPRQSPSEPKDGLTYSENFAKKRIDMD